MATGNGTLQTVFLQHVPLGGRHKFNTLAAQAFGGHTSLLQTPVLGKTPLHDRMVDVPFEHIISLRSGNGQCAGSGDAGSGEAGSGDAGSDEAGSDEASGDGDSGSGERR